MEYCKQCLMPSYRPGSFFDEEGVCQACRNYENRSDVDWEERKQELVLLCDKYRKFDGSYDCLIAVSGGKDSHFLVYTMKSEMKMNPLLITVTDHFTKTDAGLSNMKNLGKSFGCDHIFFDINYNVFRKVNRIATEEFGEPLRFLESAIYIVPLQVSVKFRIPFLIFGENGAYEYGSTNEESLSALPAICNKAKYANYKFWFNKGLKKDELNPIILPGDEDLKRSEANPIFLSYFYQWSSVTNLAIARRFGFKDLTHEWKREGCIEDFEQIDSIAYMVHLWMKYPKFGFQRTSDIASRRIREGLLNISKAKQLIMENDHKLDQKALDDFNKSLGYTTGQFWDIVERFWNPELFKKVGVLWKLKCPIYNDLL